MPGPKSSFNAKKDKEGMAVEEEEEKYNKKIIRARLKYLPHCSIKSSVSQCDVACTAVLVWANCSSVTINITLHFALLFGRTILQSCKKISSEWPDFINFMAQSNIWALESQSTASNMPCS